MRPLLTLASRELRRAWRRHLLTALALSAGVATMIASDLISRSVTAGIAESAESAALTGFMSEQLNVGLTAVGLVITFGAGFLLFNAFAMAVSQRRADLGRLRALGMTRRQTTGMMLIEALAVGAAGIVLGAIGGVALGRGLMRVVEATSPMFNRFASVPLSAQRLLTSAGAGLLITLLAVWIPTRQAARTPPLAALRNPPASETGPHRRRITALLAAAVGVMWTWLALNPPGRWMLPPASTRLNAACIALWLLAAADVTPACIGVIGDLLRPPLGRLLGAPGMLAADNLRRARGRVTFTLLTIAVGVGMIVAAAGYVSYWFDELFFRTSEQSLLEQPGMGIFPIDVEAGMQAYSEVTDFTLPQELIAEVSRAVAGRAQVVESYFVLAPELSFMGEHYFSYIFEPRAMRASGDLLFSFSYGDWDRALAISDQGCGLFITPTVARKNDVWLYDDLTLTTPLGPLTCTVAGIGPTFVGASIISRAGLSSFNLGAPVGIDIFPLDPATWESVQADLHTITARYPGAYLIDLSQIVEKQMEAMESVRAMMGAMLLLAVVSSALGVVNTALISLAERRREYGLLRAAGATRRQVMTIVLTEGLLFGLLGAAIGAAAGAGVVALYVVITGGGAFGYPDFPIWGAARSSVASALRNGAFALLFAPPLMALAAWLPSRRILGGSVLHTLGRSGPES